jgi:hypothetical protein
MKPLIGRLRKGQMLRSLNFCKTMWREVGEWWLLVRLDGDQSIRRQGPPKFLGFGVEVFQDPAVESMDLVA